VRSAYRSPEHNRGVGGAVASGHLDGAAFDIAMANHDPEAFETAARAAGFRSFGFYPRSGFMHMGIAALRRRNGFVVGLDPFNLRLLQGVRNAEAFAFHSLLSFDEIAAAHSFDLERLMDKARAALRAFPDHVDAIVGYWDFPTVLMMPILRREFGLGGPSLESVLRLEHKYWARRRQKRLLPHQTPHFELVDPFDPDAVGKISLRYPFRIKPIKAHSSILGFHV
jgi:hypothetical protein